jgi:hypothetical protein
LIDMIKSTPAETLSRLLGMKDGANSKQASSGCYAEWWVAVEVLRLASGQMGASVGG